MTLRAAGAVVWRRRDDGTVEVALVHRPRYDDWSLPKGKAGRGEHLTSTAVREVGEETGVHVALGRPLGEQRYDVRTKAGAIARKVVHYWAAEAPADAPDFAPGDEVDDLRWLALDEAAATLTWERDRGVLEALGPEPVRTVPVVVLRHADAVPRDEWPGSDDEKRPLSPLGERQATRLVPVLGAYGVRRVLSSPSARCLDTVTPYAAAAGLSVATDYALTEQGGNRGDRSAADLAELLDAVQPAVLCTHRPLLAGLMRLVAERAEAPVPGPCEPPLEKGELLVAHVAEHTRRVVATERHQPEA